MFPLAVLPAPVQAIGLVNPLTWWIEGVRHALFPGGDRSIGGPGSLCTELTGRDRARTPATIVIALLVTGALVTLAAAVIFRVE